MVVSPFLTPIAWKRLDVSAFLFGLAMPPTAQAP
jgi:hypothetical protein